MRKSPFLLSLLLVSTACSTSNKAAPDSTSMAATATPVDDNAAKDAVAKVRQSWKDMADKKDSAGVAALYSDDAVLVGTNVPMATGKAEIETRLGQMFSASSVASIDSKETVVGSDVAYDYGTFHQTITPPKGKAMEVDGTYIVTLHKQADGSWKITHHMSNVQPPKA
jgi:uncharacterized protein (TIGR02246 family)